MTRQFATASHHTNCCPSSAAACTSARIHLVMDTIAAVVSIFVISLAVLRVWV